MRFNVDEFVQMRDVIVSPYQGQIGRIVDAKPHPGGKQTLDKYRVRFPDGETVEAWSIQLVRVKGSAVTATA